MTFVLPNPTTPANGQPGDATPILQNELAIAQAINDFDGSQIHAKTIAASSLVDAANPQLRDSESLPNYVYSGCLWSTVSNLSGTMAGGTVYVNGYRAAVIGVPSQTFTASCDTYVDIDYLGSITYNSVSNNAAAPSLTANALRVAKVVTSVSAITAISQSGFDSHNVPVYPLDPLLPVGWQAWSPVFTSITIGSGVLTGTYTRIGKTIIAKANFQTATDTSYSASTYQISLPVNFYTPAAGTYQVVGTWRAYDSTASRIYGVGDLQVTTGGTTAFLLYSFSGAGALNGLNGAQLSNFGPGVSGSGSYFDFNFIYQGA